MANNSIKDLLEEARIRAEISKNLQVITITRQKAKKSG